MGIEPSLLAYTAEGYSDLKYLQLQWSGWPAVPTAGGSEPVG